MRNISTADKKRAQVFQNNCLKFVKNVKKRDRINMEDLHAELKIEPLNIRIDKMANKTLNKIREMYHIPKDEERFTTYKYSAYEIKDQPFRKRKMTIAERINKFLIKPRSQTNVIKSEPERHMW